MADPLYCPWLFAAPCMKPEVWAAWWQAILSAAAILAAARLASRQERRQLNRRAGFYVSLLDSAAQTAEKVLTASMSGLADVKAVAAPAAYKLAQLGKAFDSALYQELPDPRLLPSIQSAGAACHSLSMVVNSTAKLETWPADLGQIHQMRELEQALANYYNEAAEVANEHHVPTAAQFIAGIRMRFSSPRYADG